MIIYGTGEKKLASPPQYVKCKCPECGEFEITFHFFKKFFHIFWIPLFPYSSRNVAYCEKCHVDYQESIPSSLMMEMTNAKSRTSTPLYLFAGSAILVIGITSLIYFDDGLTTHYYASKQKQAVGKYVNNLPEGKWTYWFENGNIEAEQYYTDGKEDSVWTWYNEAGVKTKMGGYKQGLYHGEWLFYFPSGALQESDMFIENRKHGKSTVYFENGNKAAEGFFKRDREDGPWTYWYENGTVMMEGLYQNGVKTGTWKFYYENGKQYNESWETDTLSYIMSLWDFEGKQIIKDGVGDYITTHDNGQKSYEGKIKGGLHEGFCTHWYADGKKKEIGKYVKGQYSLLNSWDSTGNLMIVNGNGYHKTFYDNGVVETESMYKNGKRHGLVLTRTIDDVMLSELNYEEGILEGDAKYYEASGKLYNTGTWKNNRQEGLWTWYHLNGEKESQVTFVNGKKDDEQTFWNEIGVHVKSEFYKNGELLKEEVY